MPKYEVSVYTDIGSVFAMGVWESPDGEEAVANMVTYAFRDSFGYYPSEIITTLIGDEDDF